MNNIQDLLWSLEGKSIKVQSYNDVIHDGQLFVSFFIDKQYIHGWRSLVERLSSALDNCFEYTNKNIDNSAQILFTVYFKTPLDNIEKLEKDIKIFSNSIINEEYYLCNRAQGVYDLKLGVSCNNNCVHCVMKGDVIKLKEKFPDKVVLDSGVGMYCNFDPSFYDIINTINNLPDNIGKIVFTGGEPTIRNDFYKIVRWIYYNKPNIDFTLQTNGRNLSDMKIVKTIRRFSRYPMFVIALHGLEDIHNSVVNNRKETGNPFHETVEGIKNVVKIFGSNLIRIQIVATNKNLKNIPDLVKFIYEELKVKEIGISYPAFPKFGNEEIEKLSPNLNDFAIMTNYLNEYALKCEDIEIYTEDVPFCIYNQITDEIKIKCNDILDKKNTTVDFMGEINKNDSFLESWLNEHSKFEKCKECILNNECVGVFKEVIYLNEQYVRPIVNMTSQMQEFLRKNEYSLLSAINLCNVV